MNAVIVFIRSAPSPASLPIDENPEATPAPSPVSTRDGWPGYQCPIWSRQVNDYIGKAAEFAKSGAQVLMVYPGPADQLKAHAAEFLTNRQWPANFLHVLDPDYAFTNAYGLH